MALRVLVIDFNSFFASVEQQLQPELRGRPVAVLPVMTDSTCCIAASYEAKRFGIKTGTRVGDARKLCPEIVLIEGRQSLYIEYHHRLVAAVDSCVPVTHVLSIDEMSCSLRGPWQEKETALRLAREIKAKIAATVGECLRSSIGIGAAREERLHACRITTVEQLCRAPKSLLRRAWNGIEGDRMYALLRGEELERPSSQRCTVGHSHVLAPKYRTLPLAEAVLHRLLQKAAARLRALGYLAGGLGVSVKFLGHQRWGDEIHFLETQDTLDFIRVFDLLWRRCPSSLPPPLAVGVTLFHLSAVSNVTPNLPQLGLSYLALDQAVDKLNQCYGKNTVYFGGAQLALDSAPVRIAFTHIPVLEKERD
jgi:DNA polymerase-4